MGAILEDAMITINSAVIAALVFLSAAQAGTIVTESPASTGGFANARRPISNPTLFDLALPTTNIHPIAIYQRLPDFVNSTIGALLQPGGRRDPCRGHFRGDGSAELRFIECLAEQGPRDGGGRVSFPACR